jgi:putative DNA primase/helicase
LTAAIEASDATLEAVQFDNEKSKTWRHFEGRALELIGHDHAVREKKEGTSTFSPVRYLPGKNRGKSNVAYATALGLDFDHLPAVSHDEVFDRIGEKGWAFIAYSTFSHMANGDDDRCFRVLLFVTRPIAPAEYQRVWQTINAALGDHADASARDISRIWYIASCPAERRDSSWVHTSNGEPVSIDRILADAPDSARDGRRLNRATPRGRVPEGERNSTLMSIAGALRRKGSEYDEILTVLRATNAARCTPPLGEDELAGITTSVCHYEPASLLLAANHTDLGNAERFVQHAGDRFRFCTRWGTWMAYGQGRWRRDEDGEAIRSARDLLRALAAEAQTITDDQHKNQVLKHALRSEALPRISAMLSLAQSLLPIATEELDQRPGWLNCVNGTVDLATGQLRPHSPADYITKQVPVVYNADADCPNWLAFLYRIMGGNERLIGFLQRALGYSLTGETSEQVLFLLYGTGANGKSTFLETLRAVLGDYAVVADFTSFVKRKSDGARNDLARLVGARFVCGVESDEGRQLDEALVKQLTGGDTITARFLFKEFFDFKPQFQIWLATNHMPGITGTDHGIWRRIRLVPFTVTIPPEQQNRALPRELLEELPGILAWAVRGCLAWRAAGLGEPPEVREATAAYRDEMDLVGRFLDDECVFGDTVAIPSKDLNELYAKWCENNGEQPSSHKALSQALRVRGCSPTRFAKGKRGWRGVRVRGEEEQPGPTNVVTGGAW